jgi:hypothetical protein
MIAPVLNIVTGSTSWAGVVMPKMPVPPRLTAPALLLPPPPHAARMAARAGTEAPITLARTRSCWRVIRPAFASS